MSKQNNQQKNTGGQQAKQQKKQAPELVPALQVRGPANGRWRAGRHFGPEPVVIPLAELSEDERVAIEADPVLSVREVEVPAPADAVDAEADG